MSRTLQPPRQDASAEEPLDHRKAAILEAVVNQYIGSALPVGSQHVAHLTGISVSSATVRAEMVALEHEGYLAQPHTSAGRIPTDKGYRFFVDHLAEPGVLGPAQRHKVSRFFDHVHGEMEQMMERTSGLLSELTSYAAVVVGPGHEAAAVRSVQLVGLGPRVALVVVVLADGAVEKRTIESEEDLSDAVLVAAGSHLQAHALGKRLSQLDQVPLTGQPAVDAVVRMASAALAAMASFEEADQVFVGGPSRLADAFDAVDTVRQVLAILEQQLVVVTLLREVLDRGLSVAIGTEHGYEPLSSCAVVVAPVSVAGHESGAVGLLGPTRMNYPQALAAAHVVGERLSERLGGVGDAPSPAPGGTSAGVRRRGERSAGGRGGGRARS